MESPLAGSSVVTEYQKGVCENGTFDENKYVVQAMSKMVCESQVPPCQMVHMLLHKAAAVQKEYMLNSLRTST